MDKSLPQTTEFTLPEKYQVPPAVIANRGSPFRWITAHFLQYWYLGLSMLLGAIGNAALASAIPLVIGMALNEMLEDPPRSESLLRFALIIVVTQIIRGLLQLGRNFSAEMIGQRIERDIRHEFYTSLLGKSMPYHSLLPVGDVMARATNDVREINFMFSPGINPGSGISELHLYANHLCRTISPFFNSSPIDFPDPIQPGTLAVFI